MSLRPRYARWFELLTTREDLTQTLEALAGTGSIELETHSETYPKVSLENLQARLQAFNQLARRYQPYWPHERIRPSNAVGTPGMVLEAALERLLNWEQAALPRIHRIESLTNEQTNLQLLESLLSRLPAGSIDLGLFAGSGAKLKSQIFVLGSGTPLQRVPPGLLTARVGSDTHEFLLAVGIDTEVDTLAAELAGFKATTLEIPPALQSLSNLSIAHIRQRFEDNQEQLQQLHRSVDDLAQPYRLHEVLGDIHRLEWFLKNVSSLPVSQNFAWVTGWTSDAGGSRLVAALRKAQTDAVIRFPDPPAGLHAPVVMYNPWWAQPFEAFAKMLGTPARDEADPSQLLAVLAPLLFGYMFGDVGQGLVLLLAGLILQRRWPLLRILVASGAAAILFGLVFGSVFGREDIIPALWVHPVQQPLPVLMVPLAGGFVIIVLGLLLSALGAWWRGGIGRWLQVDAAIALLYLSIVSAFFVPQARLVALFALAWYFAGCLAQAGPRLGALLAAAGHLLETVLQMLVNTVSFVRVGAFALAHGGLSMAFNTMADASGNVLVSLFIVVLGNVVVIALEGLVVSIQTTRLILFEFFIRFLTGSGRSFQPLAAPEAEPDMRRLT